jgi:hypothetical protein
MLDYTEMCNDISSALPMLGAIKGNGEASVTRFPFFG